MFSAPVALTKRKYEKTFGWLRIVVGPRVYTLQFYTSPISAATFEAAPALVEPRKGAATFERWREVLEQYAGAPPDGQPLIAAVTPPALIDVRKRMSRGDLRVRLAILGTVFLVGGIGAVMLLNAGHSTAESQIILLPIFIAIAIAAALITTVLNKKRQKIELLPLPHDQVAPTQGDILAPNTAPTGGFGLTQGKAFSLGIGLGLALIPIAIILLAIAGGISQAIAD
jgi:hypothetical protein